MKIASHIFIAFFYALVYNYGVMESIATELLFDYCKIHSDTATINDLSKFCDFLLEKNKQFNLTAIREERDVYVKHFCDSLMGREYFKACKKIVEVGSGAGFPSVPLKIYNRALDFTLIEATGKKCEFLKQTKLYLEFEKFWVINGRSEELALKDEYRAAFDTVTARAVASLDVLSEISLPLLKTGGRGVFYKLYSPLEIKSAIPAIELLGGQIAGIKEYTLPFTDQKRCIIVVEKVKDTPDGYPREYKAIKKRPLSDLNLKN